MFDAILHQQQNRRDFFKTCATLSFLSFTLGHSQEYGAVSAQEARYYKQLADGKVKCLLCPHGCIVPKGRKGLCGVRENRKGEYYTIAYGNPCSLHPDPIEKKPLFHFLPGTNALSIATAGCNFSCRFCQNWQISQTTPNETLNYNITPKELVDLSLKYKQRYKIRTIAYTYTEPSIFFEYMLDSAKLARKKGIKNIYHSNGYLNQEPLEELCNFLDGANVDLKSFREEFYNQVCGGSLQPVLRTLKKLSKRKVHLEITNLIVPTLNDSEIEITEMCKWIVDNLGPDTPIHFSRFHPMYKLTQLSATPINTLKKAVQIAREEGLRYIYMGNVPGNKYEDTFCPNCGRLIIDRKGYHIIADRVKNGRCIYCNQEIAGVW